MRTLPLATSTLPHQAILDIQAVLLEMERNGIEATTRRCCEHTLKALAKKTDLNDPNQTKTAIAQYIKRNGEPASNGFKRKLADCYNYYTEYFNIPWTKPSFTLEEHSIQPPTSEQCEKLISGARMPLSLKIQVSYETGLRPIEVEGNKGLKAKDIHPDQKTITSVNTKRCNARPPIAITTELVTRLQTYILENKIKPEDRIFPCGTNTYSEQFRRYKHRLANKLKDPAIVNIRLYDLRHYYITKQLRKCQNAEIVRQLVGHKCLNTTQRYLHLLAGENGEWIVEQTNDKQRAKQLLEADYTYVMTTPDGYMTFRKAK